jgi:hypothetical protein
MYDCRDFPCDSFFETAKIRINIANCIVDVLAQRRGDVGVGRIELYNISYFMELSRIISNHERFALRRSFAACVPCDEGQPDEGQIQVALSCYVRALTSFNSRFDQYMRGDDSRLNAEERHGFNVFMGKEKCGTCHFMPLFNGTVPPTFTHTESEVIGFPTTVHGKELDKDPGRFAIHQIEKLSECI